VTNKRPPGRKTRGQALSHSRRSVMTGFLIQLPAAVGEAGRGLLAEELRETAGPEARRQGEQAGAQDGDPVQLAASGSPKKAGSATREGRSEGRRYRMIDTWRVESAGMRGPPAASVPDGEHGASPKEIRIRTPVGNSKSGAKKDKIKGFH
jgi:hypothetical protein